MTTMPENARDLLPEDAAQALLIGRVFDMEAGGPVIVRVDRDRLVDISDLAPTVAQLLNREGAPDAIASAQGGRSWSLDEVMRASTGEGPVRLLAPIDLQTIKACGVTFVASMLERVVEEVAAGDAGAASAARHRVAQQIGERIHSLVPGSEQAMELKTALQEAGVWSQYLEVGIGSDPEVFTKAPVLSAVGSLDQIGVLARSEWSNPEPELVLVADSTGRAVGATLGNDVNLRDIEGRSALLLGAAKDNNASCALGPFIRLFDERFTMDDARETEITLRIRGKDGFELSDVSRISEISRPLESLLSAVRGPHHQYPDGFVLFTGTPFAPIIDRAEIGQGFTHHDGDVVSISAPRLGELRNVVGRSEDVRPWTFGLSELFEYLLSRDGDRTREGR